MNTKIKICGITNPKDAFLAADLGVDAIGFVFAKSPRQVEPDEVRKIVRQLPPFLATVGVFVNESQSLIQEIADFCRLHLIQWSGDEDLQYCKNLKRSYIKVFKVRDAGVLENLKENPSQMFLLDTYVKGKNGGTGKTFNWEIARLAKYYGRIILAGGLTPGNIREALNKVSPFGVDVSSGVEESPGKKDKRKVTQFVDMVRSWDGRMDTLVLLEGGFFPKP
jgi:phosphoribosylanthranilate isomerase